MLIDGKTRNQELNLFVAGVIFMGSFILISIQLLVKNNIHYSPIVD